MSVQTDSQREQFVAVLLQLLHQTRVGPRYYPEERFHSELWSDHAGFLSTAISLAPMTRGQLFQDAWVTYESKWKQGGYFVEFGASDGVMSSNTLMLERHFGWTGILAEPHPQTSAQLRRNRACFVSSKCVTAKSGEWVDFAMVAADPHLSTVARYAGSDGHAQKRSGAATVQVETLSLLDLLQEADAPDVIDYLSIDTEGSEYDILQAFDFSRYWISLISVEHNYTSARDELHRLLTSAGYARKFECFSRWDDWYVRVR